MALFHQSTKSVSAVVQEIADSAGVSGDADMTNRAGRSLFAGIEHLNNRANWDWTLVEAPPTSIVAPFIVTGISASAGQVTAALPVGHGFQPYDLFTAGYINAGTRVSATAAGSVTLYSGFSAGMPSGVNVLTATGTRDCYSLPTDYKEMYSLRLMGAQSTLRPIRRRIYDRSIISEFSATTPVGYDIFLTDQLGVLRILPPPVTADVLQARYYRRMTVPTTSATADALDISQDFEPYLIAWAKWHFLMDKGEGRGDQAQTWFSFADNGYKTMLSNQARVPDEDLMFTPGHYSYNPTLGPNSVRGHFFDYDW